MRTISDDELLNLDLSSFCSGRLPYGEHDTSFEIAFIMGVDYYRDYVTQRTGFVNGGKVLDLLCGFGRWSIFLAENNQEVYGIDTLEDCIKIADGLCNHFGLDNTKFMAGDVSLTQNFDDDYFDNVWMWSGLQYVHRGNVLAEIYRILKPGGRLYVGNYNSTGLMIEHVMKGVKTKKINEGSSQWALNALQKGEMYNGNPNFLTFENAGKLLNRFNMNCVAASAEGGLDIRCKGGVREDFDYTRTDLNLVRTIEFLAEKPVDYQQSEVEKFRSMLDHDEQNSSVPVDIAKDLNDLGKDDPYVQQDARTRLVHRGLDIVPLLVTQLDDDNQYRAGNAKLAIQEIGNYAIPLLVQNYSTTNKKNLKNRIKEIINQISPEFLSCIKRI